MGACLGRKSKSASQPVLPDLAPPKDALPVSWPLVQDRDGDVAHEFLVEQPCASRAVWLLDLRVFPVAPSPPLS